MSAPAHDSFEVPRKRSFLTDTGVPVAPQEMAALQCIWTKLHLTLLSLAGEEARWGCPEPVTPGRTKDKMSCTNMCELSLGGQAFLDTFSHQHPNKDGGQILAFDHHW